MIVDEIKAASQLVEDDIGGRASESDDLSKRGDRGLLLRPDNPRAREGYDNRTDHQRLGDSIHRPILLKDAAVLNLTLKPATWEKVSTGATSEAKIVL